MRIICFRGGRSYSAFRLVISWDSQQNTLSDVAVGWERDLTGKPAKLSVDLRSRFDPIRFSNRPLMKPVVFHSNLYLNQSLG